MHERAEDAVADDPVEAAGDERPDRDEQAVVLRIIHQVPGGAGRQDERDPRQQNDREHRLGPIGQRPLLSSRSATKTGRGRWSTSAARSHQSRIPCRASTELVTATV